MRLTISTPRLLLRAPETSDAEALARIAADFDVAKMTSSMPHPYTLECAEGFIAIARARLRLRRSFSFVIEAWGEDGLSRGVIGGAGVFQRGRHGASATDWEIGYHLGKPHWGQGYATEAVLGLVGWAREELGAAHLAAGHFEDNPASGRVLRKAGFRPTGACKAHYSMARGEKAACIDYALDLAAGSTATEAAA